MWSSDFLRDTEMTLHYPKTVAACVSGGRDF